MSLSNEKSTELSKEMRDAVSNISIQQEKKEEEPVHDKEMVLVFVKSYCPHSKNACRLLSASQLFVYDIQNAKWLMPTTFAEKEVNDAALDQRTVNRIMTRHTVPQIFVWRNKDWHYVGEESDILNTMPELRL